MKILYVTTVSDTIGFFTRQIKILIEKGHTVDIACNIGKPLPPELLQLGCQPYDVKFERSPYKKGNFSAYKNLKSLIIQEKYDIVHTHTPVASVFTRLACRNLRGIRVIYTAHGFHFFKGAPLINWLLYYPVERVLAAHTDALITINKEDYELAKKSFKPKSLEYVPGVGINISKWEHVVVERTEICRQLNIPQNSFILLSVGELNNNKNHQTVIKAISKIKKPNIHYVICGEGPNKKKLTDLIDDLGLNNQVSLLGYRTDIPNICKVSHAFIFPSFREGLSVALMEAMACRLPVICSNIRGNRDLIINKKGGFLVNPNDVDGFSEAVVELINNYETIGKSMGQFNNKSIKEFDFNNVTKKIEKIYSQSDVGFGEV